MTKKAIETTAKQYQAIDRQIKELTAKQKPLKTQLLDYAGEHKKDFDESFQLKFPNGTYISLRVKDVLAGSKEAKAKILEAVSDEYAKVELDEALLLTDAPNNARLKKLLTQHGIEISQKETLAVYAG